MKHIAKIITILFLILITQSLFSQHTPAGVPPIAVEQGKQEEKIALATGNFQLDGIASYYGKAFHNRKTANGEIFDMESFTAAHRTLPFNTLVEVTNLQNGKKVVVRINDRGPYLKNRVIDLSKRAASVIDMISGGTANVQLKILHLGSKDITTSTASDGSTQYDIAHFVNIQVASYAQRESASRLINTLAKKNISATIEEYNNFYRVVIPHVDNKTINSTISTLKSMGLNKVLVKTPQ